MQVTQPKTILMSQNGTTQQQKFFDWSAVLVAIAIALATGSFAFAWNMNSTVAVMQEQRTQDKQYRDELKQDINQIKLDIREVRDKVIRSEKTN